MTALRAQVCEERKLQARTAKAMRIFLRSYRECGNVRDSCRVAKVGRFVVYAWRKVEPFKSLFEQARDDAIDALESEARRRAVDGVVEPMVSAGSHVCDVRKYSDTLLLALLKGKRPEEFRERQEHTGPGGKPLFPGQPAIELGARL